MTSWEAGLLGILQGATEFLPVSSSGHLVVGQALLGLELPGVAFEVAVHVATLLSVVVVYRARLGGLASGVVMGEARAWGYLGLLALATVPAALIGVLLGDAVEALFDSTWVTGAGFLVTGTILWSARAAQARGAEPKTPGAREAGLIGLAQAFAMIPGVSRSGTTVVVALWLGLEAREAAAFSFLMSIPAIAGAALLQVPEMTSAGYQLGIAPVAVGMALAAATGVLAIRTFVALLTRGVFHRFALYVWGLGITVLIAVALAA